MIEELTLTTKLVVLSHLGKLICVNLSEKDKNHIIDIITDFHPDFTLL